MIYTISRDTAEWIREQKTRKDLSSKPRKGWVLDGLGGGGTNSDLAIFQVQGGDAAHGFDGFYFEDLTKPIATQDQKEGKIYAVEIAMQSSLPPGTLLLGHRAAIRATGGND